jgi:hypothetical protein
MSACSAASGVTRSGLAELRQELLGARDRPRHQLREEGQVERDVQEVPMGRERAAVDVDHVGDGVEGVERDAERQHHRADAVADPEPGEVLGEEAAVLEVREDRDGSRRRRARRATVARAGSGPP